MDHHHSWRPPPPNQGNICPTCSISHFPFCPPHPHPSAYPAPNSDPKFGPLYNNPSYPYYDPGYSNPNPSLGNLGNVNGGPYSMQNLDYNNVHDRSNKRLRVDACTNYSGFGFGGDMRGFAVENSGFDRNADARDPGMRPPSNVGYGVNYQMNELQHQTGYGSRYGVKRSASEVEHQPLAQHGHVVKPPDHTAFHQGGIGVGHENNDRLSHGYHYSSFGVPHGSSESFYGGNSNAQSQYDPSSNVPSSNHYSSSHPPFPAARQQPGELRYDYGSPRYFSDVRPPIETRPPPIDGYQVPAGNQIVSRRPHYGPPHMNYQGGYGNSISENMGHIHASQGFDAQPPLPASPPPPLPMEPPPRVSPSLFPVPVGSSAPIHSSHASIPESHGRPTSHLFNSQPGHVSHGVFQGDPQGTLTSFGQYIGDGQRFPSKNNLPDKPKTMDAAHLFKPPHRTSRPDHFVIILRGLPGSGKSYLAKMLRDLEVEHGGNAPRIHSMDDYFMTEVEKVEENEASKSSVRFKKSNTKKVLEYCYEPEMEEAYRSSMLKAFKKTLEEGAFTFVIVDDRNLRVADFAQFWATAKRSGYEVYVLEAPYKDPAGCTARNVHGFTQVDVEKMAAQWEEAPSMYLQMDVKSLFHGDNLKESNIEEVDMDTEDGAVEGGLHNLDERGAETNVSSSGGDQRPSVSLKDEKNWNAEVGHATEEVKDLGSSKWSSNLDDDDNEKNEVLKGKAHFLSGLVRTYRREGKSVHWGDQGGHTGFSIGAVKKANLASLVIGPGVGYNLKSNPLPNEDATTRKSGEAKKHSVFKERLRAEQESFKAVFDRRRQRIGGLVAEED